MKKRIMAAVAAVLSLSMCMTSFAAGWEKNNTGYRYKGDDGNYLTDAMTPDGYYINADGYWNWGSNDITAKFTFFGNRYFKSHGDAVLNDDGFWVFTADAYDTGLFDEGTLKALKKGQTIMLPDIGTEVTVTGFTKPRQISQTVTSKDGTKTKQTVMSDYKVTGQDADGNVYNMTHNKTMKQMTDGSIQQMVRLVATDITLAASKYREPLAGDGSHSASMEEMAKSTTLFIDCTLRDYNSVDDITDPKINYMSSVMLKKTMAEGSTTPVAGEISTSERSGSDQNDSSNDN